jgi:uncharacterized membrane protein
MTTILIASFINEHKAEQGMKKLFELETLGELTIHESAVVKKSITGETNILDSDTSEGIRTVSGMAIGTLIGAFAGPVGVVVGMMTGTLFGAAADVDYIDFTDELSSKVTDRLQPGTTAIIAEIDEDHPYILDDALAPLEAVITRIDEDIAYGYYEDEETEEIDYDIASERARIKSSNAAEKAKIQQKIADLKQKRKERISNMKARHKERREERKESADTGRITRLRRRIAHHQERISVLEAKIRKLQE